MDEQIALNMQNEIRANRREKKTFTAHSLKKPGTDNVQEELCVQELALSEEERRELEILNKTGYEDWTKAEFQEYINGCEKFGRYNYSAIA